MTESLAKSCRTYILYCIKCACGPRTHADGLNQYLGSVTSSCLSFLCAEGASRGRSSLGAVGEKK